MHGLTGERVLMRIHLGERDKHHGKPLCVDTEEKIQAILPELDEMIGGGLIMLERARVIMYRPNEPTT